MSFLVHTKRFANFPGLTFLAAARRYGVGDAAHDGGKANEGLAFERRDPFETTANLVVDLQGAKKGSHSEEIKSYRCPPGAPLIVLEMLVWESPAKNKWATPVKQSFMGEFVIHDPDIGRRSSP